MVLLVVRGCVTKFRGRDSAGSHKNEGADPGQF